MAQTNTMETMAKNYKEMKRKHPDAILLFRGGDFYESYCDDAVDCADILGTRLTRRSNGKKERIHRTAFPHQSLDTCLPKLIRAGKRVAICEQIEDPKLAKKRVTRGIPENTTGTAE